MIFDGNKLRAIREARAMSRRQLLNATGGVVTEGMLMRYEFDGAQPAVTIALALARALEVDLDALMTEEVGEAQ